MIVQDPEMLNKISEWRRKSVDGTITLDEMREAVKALRQNRVAAITAAGEAKRSAKPKAPVRAAADLLSDLENF